jgi:hypothetical protein
MPINTGRGIASSSAHNLRKPPQYDGTHNRAESWSEPLPVSPAAAAAAAGAVVGGAGVLSSRHQSLLELWHILKKLRAGNCINLVREL